MASPFQSFSCQKFYALGDPAGGYFLEDNFHHILRPYLWLLLLESASVAATFTSLCYPRLFKGSNRPLSIRSLSILP
jgi:hypothetical protein